MRVRPLTRFLPRFRHSVLGFSVCTVWLGCGQAPPEPRAPAGAEAEADHAGADHAEADHVEADHDPAKTRAAAETPASPRPGAPGEQPQEPRPIVDPEADRAERERTFARSLLAHAPTPTGQLGVVFVAGQRTADLLWTVAVENRSEETFLLATDVSLLELTLTPPPPLETTDGLEPPDPKKVKASPLPQTFGVLPDVAVDEVLELEPGEIIVGSFDPRDHCPEEWLVEGTEVRAAYGYAIGTEVRWERGKRVERLLTEKQPFVLASKLGEGDIPVQSAKLLTSAPFVLGETYPLSGVALRAEEDPSNPLAATNKDSRPPESPVKLTLADLGHAGRTLYKVMQVTLTNQTSESIDIVVKRELLSFEVTGPRGATTCVLEPTKIDPLSHNFTRLAPGQSRSLAIRLPEACPAGTFDLPGQYNVMARYRSPSSGAEFGKSGFVGEVRAERGARFTVDGRPGQPVAKPFRKVGPATAAPNPGGKNSANPSTP